MKLIACTIFVSIATAHVAFSAEPTRSDSISQAATNFGEAYVQRASVAMDKLLRSTENAHIPNYLSSIPMNYVPVRFQLDHHPLFSNLYSNPAERKEVIAHYTELLDSQLSKGEESKYIKSIVARHSSYVPVSLKDQQDYYNRIHELFGVILLIKAAEGDLDPYPRSESLSINKIMAVLRSHIAPYMPFASAFNFLEVYLGSEVDGYWSTYALLADTAYNSNTKTPSPTLLRHMIGLLYKILRGMDEGSKCRLDRNSIRRSVASLISDPEQEPTTELFRFGSDEPLDVLLYLRDQIRPTKDLIAGDRLQKLIVQERLEQLPKNSADQVALFLWVKATKAGTSISPLLWFMFFSGLILFLSLLTYRLARIFHDERRNSKPLKAKTIRGRAQNAIQSFFHTGVRTIRRSSGVPSASVYDTISFALGRDNDGLLSKRVQWPLRFFFWLLASSYLAIVINYVYRF